MLSSNPPADFPIWFPFYFAGMWCAVCLLISVAGGWRRLARTYPAPPGKPEGRKFSGQSGGFGWCNYNRCLTIHTSPEGLRLSIMFLFRLGSPPILIPWGEIRNCEVKRFLWIKSVKFDAGFPPVARLRLPGKVFEGYEDLIAGAGL